MHFMSLLALSVTCCHAEVSPKPRQHDFIVMSWIKPAIVLRALRQGYVVLSAGQSKSPLSLFQLAVVRGCAGHLAAMSARSI